MAVPLKKLSWPPDARTDTAVRAPTARSACSDIARSVSWVGLCEMKPRTFHVIRVDSIVPMPIPHADGSPPGNESGDIGFPRVRRQEDRLVRRARLARDPQFLPGMPDATDALGDIDLPKPADNLDGGPSPMPLRRNERKLRAQRGPILAVGHLLVRAPGADAKILSLARRGETHREQRRDARLAEALARHVAPHLGAAPHADEGFEAPPHRALPEAEVFQSCEEQQPE